MLCGQSNVNMLDKISIPVAGVYIITFKFGEAPDWYLKIFGEPHNGLDFAVPTGTPIQACDNGVVTFSDKIPDVNGCGLIISHSWGTSLYWHLSKLFAKSGAVVERKQMIGLSGMTGYATGPHLHFGIKPKDTDKPTIGGYIDPEPYLDETAPVVSPPAEVKKYHIVMWGESLYSIATKYYGNGLLWNRIFEANKDKIKNSNLIYPLQRLLIP